VGGVVSEVLAVLNLSKTFTLHELNREIPVLKEVSLTINKGEFIGITGQSGSGKSTVFRCIYRTYLPQAGEIWFESDAFGWLDLARADLQKIIHLRKHEIGLVSQFLKAPPRTSALEIVKAAALERGWSNSAAQHEAEKILCYFDLKQELWDSYPTSFSGGEKLRLGIAKAMVTQPRLLLLDEPTASLDVAAKQKVRDLMQQLMRTGTTMLGIFHDLDFMGELCHREYHMAGGRLTLAPCGEMVYAD
jgi:alpha-D-ribose 1-methylphosphonate 5-triphosphate synthase subunit PhnL